VGDNYFISIYMVHEYVNAQSISLAIYHAS